jgi:hypothetical protein
LKPYLRLVKNRISKNAENIAWVTLDERFRALVDHAEGILAYFASGKAGSRFERIAAQEVVKLAKEVKPREVVEVTAAMVMMWTMEPRWFRSDNAFRIQLARRVRSLTDLHVGERYDHVRGKIRRHYRELTSKAALILGHWLATTLGVGGQHLARIEEAERDKKARESREIARGALEAGVTAGRSNQFNGHQSAAFADPTRQVPEISRRRQKIDLA